MDGGLCCYIPVHALTVISYKKSWYLLVMQCQLNSKVVGICLQLKIECKIKAHCDFSKKKI